MSDEKNLEVIDSNVVDQNLEIIEVPPMPQEIKSEIPNVQHITVDFSKENYKVHVKITATDQDQKIQAASGKIRLIHGRLYAIPIKEDNVNSDNYKIIKIYSNLAAKIDVRYIMDGFAFVKPIVHNIEIYDGTKLCVLLDPITNK